MRRVCTRLTLTLSGRVTGVQVRVGDLTEGLTQVLEAATLRGTPGKVRLCERTGGRQRRPKVDGSFQNGE